MPSNRIRALAIPALAAFVVIAVWIALPGQPEQHVGNEPRPGAGTEPTGGHTAASTARGTRLQGHPASPPPRAVRDPDSMPSRFGRPEPADPWASGDADAEGTTDAQGTIRIGPFRCVRVSRTGEVTFDTEAWTERAAAPGFELAAYDLSPWAPQADGLRPASVGITNWNLHSPERTRAWWEKLVVEIVAAVGHDRWAHAHALIAWDVAHATLYVRQDVSGHARVEDVINRRASRGLTTLRLVVVAEPGTTQPGQRLALDVPSARAVFAQRGRAWAYLQDFDIEVGQESFTARPIVASLDVGLAVSVLRIDPGGAADVLDVAVATAPDPAGIVPFDVGMGNLSVPVELPECEAAWWRGSIPASPGKHLIELEDGQRVTLAVTESEPCPMPQPPFTRHLLAPAGVGTEAPRTSCPRRLVVTWHEAGPRKGKVIEVPLVAKNAHGEGLLARGSCTVDLHGVIVDASSRTCPWPLQEGGVRVQAAVFAAGAIDVLDLLVEQCAPAHEVRESIRYPSWAWGDVENPTEPRSLSLPVCAMRTDTRRAHVPVGADAAIYLNEDAGVTFRVSLSRDE